jgi:hypothetical protein
MPELPSRRAVFGMTPENELQDQLLEYFNQILSHHERLFNHSVLLKMFLAEGCKDSSTQNNTSSDKNRSLRTSMLVGNDTEIKMSFAQMRDNLGSFVTEEDDDEDVNEDDFMFLK